MRTNLVRILHSASALPFSVIIAEKPALSEVEWEVFFRLAQTFALFAFPWGPSRSSLLLIWKQILSSCMCPVETV
jgi:hypothetical protein